MISLQPADGRSGRVSAWVVAQEALLLAQNSSVPAEPVKLEVTGPYTNITEPDAEYILKVISNNSARYQRNISFNFRSYPVSETLSDSVSTMSTSGISDHASSHVSIVRPTVGGLS
jgi:hypothetical protein